MYIILLPFIIVAVLWFSYSLYKAFGRRRGPKGVWCSEREPSGMCPPSRWFFRGYCLVFLGGSCALLCALDCYKRTCHCRTVNRVSSKKTVAVCHDEKPQQESAKLGGSERTNHAKTMAIEKHINPGKRYMNNRRSRHIKKAENGLWPIPTNLIDELAEADVSYFQSIMQPAQTGTCGSRCVANALSIGDAQEKGALDAMTAYGLAANYNYLHKRNNLSNRAVAQLADSMGLEHLHVIGFYERDCITDKPKKNPFTCTGSTDHGFAINLYDEATIQQTIMQTIRNSVSITAHFVCSLKPITAYDTGHWILITIIKQKNKKPKMIYMDSCNVPLAQEPQSQAYMSYLYWQSIA